MEGVNLSAIRREYGATALDEKHMAASPLDQCRIWLEAAIQTEKQDPTAMVLSTIDESGAPDARVVLLKDLQTDGFVFYTDYRSAKGKQLEINPAAALLFYWPVLSRQIRIKGKVNQLSREASDAYFASRPYLSQLSAYASHQSLAILNRESLEEQVEQLRHEHPEGTLKCPDHWGGYLLTPEAIEFWQGRDNRLHDRILYMLKKGVWHRCRLAP